MLLTADLGRPERFINKLRVLKPQSAMSVGSWTLTVFSGASTTALVPIGQTAASATRALFGCGMLTYTGVLIGATAIPVWHEHVRTLPLHFAASGMASAASLLTLMGHDVHSPITSLAHRFAGSDGFDSCAGAPVIAPALNICHGGKRRRANVHRRPAQAGPMTISRSSRVPCN